MRRLPGLVLLCAAPLLAQRPLHVDDLYKVVRVGNPQVSSAGDVAYQAGVVDLAANKVHNSIWIRWANKNNGITGRGMALELGEGNQARPRFSPDAKSMAYEQGGQIWIVNLDSLEKRQLTKLSGGASGELWSPDGKWIAFLSTTVPSGDDAENAAYLKAHEGDPVKAFTTTTLMFRHWTERKDPQQLSHLFIVKADGSEAPRDLSKGFKTDIPHFSDVAAGDGYDWAPDSSRLAFESHPDQWKATSTNGEIYEVALSNGAVRKLSDNPAMDTTPRYSPDGKSLAWRAQRRPGFEADKFELWVMDRGSNKVVRTTKAWDRSVGLFAWNGAELLLTAEDAGHVELYRWLGSANPAEKVQRISRGLHVEDLALRDKEHALVQLSDSATPPDLYDLDLLGGGVTRFSHQNEPLVNELKLNRAEDLWFNVPYKGVATKVHGFVVKPVGFDAKKKYPVAFLVHGGPQGAWADAWSGRWNAQTWAGRGYLAVMINFHGSTGYGQAFEDEITGDWNGQPMRDLMGGLDAALRRYPNADPKRVICAGASYGGYAVNWIAGHYADRFKAFICHAGIFNTESMQLATEELWFPHWEFKGWPWDSPERKQFWQSMSPHNAAANFKKPMFVIAGELDYRVPYTEGLADYQVHQLRGIPSQLMLFPDEGHWVLKPRNNQVWQKAMLDWADRWAK